MSLFFEYSEFFNRPILLTETEKLNPSLVFERICTDYNLAELREVCENISSVCLTSDFPPYDDGNERANLQLFCKNVIALFEAVFCFVKPELAGEKQVVLGN